MTKTKETIRRKKRKNVRIFPIYKTVSWDLLFYFPIIFLFLTQVKGLTPAEVLFADAFYTLANTFWQLPITSLVDRIGKKNCLIIGNILYALSILAMIFMKDFYDLFLGRGFPTIFTSLLTVIVVFIINKLVLKQDNKIKTYVILFCILCILNMISYRIGIRIAV
mgnify:CR=1 FL=1